MRPPDHCSQPAGAMLLLLLSLSLSLLWLRVLGVIAR